MSEKDEQLSSSSGKPKKRVPRQTKTDDELLAVLEAEGEQAYIAMLYKSLAKRLKGFLAKLVEPEYQNKIEDILQEGFFNFHIMIKNKLTQELLIPQPMNHYNYLCQVMRSVYFDEYKKRRQYQTVPFGTNEDSTEGQDVDEIENEASIKVHDLGQIDLSIFLGEVSESIEELKEPYKTVMRLIRDEDLSEEEIALRLMLPPERIKIWMHRGRVMLKEKHRERLEYLQLRKGKKAGQ